MTKQPFNKEFIMNATIDNYDEFSKSLKKAQSAAIALRDAIDEINEFIPQLSVSELDSETTSNFKDVTKQEAFKNKTLDSLNSFFEDYELKNVKIKRVMDEKNKPTNRIDYIISMSRLR